MPAVRYLTVQDAIWINALLTGSVQGFHFADLEEATYLQYGYGASQDVPAQAGRMLRCFAAKAPFDLASEATAFVAFASFLLLNGCGISLSDEQCAKQMSEGASGIEDVAASAVPLDGEHGAYGDVQEVVRTVVATYPQTLAALGVAASARA